MTVKALTEAGSKAVAVTNVTVLTLTGAAPAAVGPAGPQDVFAPQATVLVREASQEEILLGWLDGREPSPPIESISDPRMRAILDNRLKGFERRDDYGYRVTVRDPAAVTGEAVYGRDGWENLHGFYTKMDALEAEGLRGLSAPEQAQYSAIRAKLAGADRALVSLQVLLLDGHLGQKDFRGGKTLLAHLSALARGEAPLVDGMDGSDLLTELVVELATPSAIEQGNRGTCGPTALFMDVARRAKAEYARIVLELASPSGNATLRSGRVVTREPRTEREDGSGRTTTQRLLGSAFVEVANGWLNYVNTGNLAAFSLREHLAQLARDLYGIPMQSMAVDRSNADAALSLVREGLRTDSLLLVSLDWRKERTSGHYVLIVGEKRENGEDVFVYLNPHGREETMTASELQSRIRSVEYDASAVSPQIARLDSGRGDLWRDAKAYARWVYHYIKGTGPRSV